MPTYEYKCLECNHRFEAFQNMTDEPLTQCEACQGKVKRLIGTGAGIIFKGSGFYCTDYRSNTYQSAAQKDTAQTSSSSTDKTVKKEANTASKTATEKSAND